MSTKAVVLHSGGLDSTVALALAVDRHGPGAVVSYGVNYGQRHAVELAAAEAICSLYGVERLVAMVDVGVTLETSSQTNTAVAVPEGHYAEESMKKTVVPNRNMMMISLAAALAIDRRADEVWYAAHAGDHAIYPDCRPAFVTAMSAALALADWHPVILQAPFIEKDKAHIVRVGRAYDVPMHLTHSCYKGIRGVHCGVCGTCVERLEAFGLAGVEDGATYSEVRV